jgi:hypothetical protein
VQEVDEDEANVSEDEDETCSTESSVRTGRRLARLDGVGFALLLRLRTARGRFNGDKKL